MATGSTNFASYTTGVAPSDWTPYNSSTLEVQAGTTPVGTKYLRLSQGAGNRWGSAYWDVVTSAIATNPSAPVETLTLLRASAFGLFLEGMGVAATNNLGGTRNGYVATINNDGTPGFGPGCATLGEGNTGGGAFATILDADTITMVGNDAWYWIRWRLNPSAQTINVWWWLDGATVKVNTDPPDLSVSSENTYLPITGVGVFRDSDTASHTLDCGFWSYGTNGDAAPVSGASIPRLSFGLRQTLNN